MYKLTFKLLPPLFNLYFKSIKEIHSYNTRNTSNNMFIPSVNKKAGHQTISFLGSQHWNKITDSIRTNKTITLFKKQYKESILNSYKRDT